MSSTWTAYSSNATNWTVAWGNSYGCQGIIWHKTDSTKYPLCASNNWFTDQSSKSGPYPKLNKTAETVAMPLWRKRFVTKPRLWVRQPRPHYPSRRAGNRQEIKRVTPLHPQADGEVERLLARCWESQPTNVLGEDWDIQIPFKRFNCMNHYHESTGYSPSTSLLTIILVLHNRFLLQELQRRNLPLNISGQHLLLAV